MQHRTEGLPIERIIAALSYLTSGLIGFVWLILGVILKLRVRPFLLYHIYQSIFLSILFFIVSFALKLVLDILSIIPLIGQLISTVTFLLTASIFGEYSIINIILLIIMLYLALTSLMGKYSYLPWVSNIIKANLRI